MKKNKFDVLQEIVSISWVYEKIFWKTLMKKLFYREDLENDKQNLKNLWYDDIDDLFPEKIDKKEFKDNSKIIFRIYDKNDDSWKSD